MDIKNTTIILILLLCFMGLIVGVYYSESSQPIKDFNDYDELIQIDDNGIITIHLEKKENESNIINKLFT